ncbi:DNA-binding protein WhiA [Gehongia tenuis]|uniref:Probable cell division protein WhiA n=1 Tax=Gehongia tenuis TaxID=2763655 RepID=A0A926D424_9FIRM|nr:DNA-binding protein WhiA [Gehongia tenuis]MBC8531368.1 DNA-binding protein WhiA [Gehongia tenuis]
MSFSSEIKEELVHVGVKRSCCIRAELTALIQMAGTIHLKGMRHLALTINTENGAVARRAFSFLKKRYGIQPQIQMTEHTQPKKSHVYELMVDAEDALRVLRDTGIVEDDGDGFFNLNWRIQPSVVESECCKRAYLRGAFLGRGSMADPEKMYHLEFVVDREELAASLVELLQKKEINAKAIPRKDHFVVYLKEGEHVIRLLSMMGAHGALLEVENIRILKDMRNNVNRKVNCETANINKTVNTAVRQIECIRLVEQRIGFDRLSPNLRQIAELRLNYPDASLQELGAMLDKPIGKAGVHHRLRKLEEMANDLGLQQNKE